MRKILIVGAGQSGLQLALGLRSHDYDVTVMSARTPDEIRNGRILSTQAMFDMALQTERKYHLNLWDDQCPNFQALQFALSAPPGTHALGFHATLDAFGQSVDQRVKMPTWLELFESRGGNVVIHGATTSDLDGLTNLYDLVIVSAGRGELVELFDRNPTRSPYTQPQRVLSVIYVHGVTPHSEHEHLAVGFNAIPGLGELFIIPALTLTGGCDILFWEGIPGGPLDCWTDRPNPQQHLTRTLDLMRRYVPWEHQRCRNAEPTDLRANLTGAFTPTVRDPVGELPSGGLVLGMADVVVANDPITGQGSNNAAKCADIYLNGILQHADQPFDRAWMQHTFDQFWATARPATEWTNAMLQPLPQHVQQILADAATNPATARRFANGFADPTDFQHWLMPPSPSPQPDASP